MKNILYKTSVIAVVSIGVKLVDAGMRLWDAGHYMDMFAKSERGK